MVWLGLTRQNSSRIKTLLEIVFFLSGREVRVVAVFHFPQYFLEDCKDSF